MAFSCLRDLLLPTTLLVLLVTLYFVSRSRRSRNPLIPMDWPIVGMLPGIIANQHNIHDYVATFLAASGHNFVVRGPPATAFRYLVTCSPANVRHMLTTNFANYVKGEELAAVLGILDGTIIAADGESWRRQRDTIHHVLKRPQLVASMHRCCRDKVAGSLVPMLSYMESTRTQFDMDDLLGRLLFDITVMVVFGWDPCRLASDMPPMDVAAALNTLMEVAFRRHCLPAFLWKLMRKMNVSHERKLAEAEAMLYRFVAKIIQRRLTGDEVTSTVDMLSYYINDPNPDFVNTDGEPTDFLHRTFINYMVAMRDPMSSALSWLVYNLATNPHAVHGMRKELAPIAARKSMPGGAVVVFEPDETQGLVYQRAALFESLRLYPVAPLERKSSVADDVLPSGHKVRAGDTILVSTYSMGRLEQVWGEDCRVYKPERWVSKDGGKLRYVPSYEFMAYNTGPRSCLGKNISVALVTSIAATVVWNFDVELLESHAVKPRQSIILQMKNGLMAKVNKRGRSDM